MKDKGDMVKVLDTRRIARKPLYYLTGAEAEAVRAARDAVNKATLVEKLVGKFSSQEIETALGYLVQENLMLHIRGEYLTLPVDRVTVGKQS